MSIKSTLEYIHKTQWLGSKPGLERTTELLTKMGRPDKKLRFVHVAGTNGKGSVCSFISSVLVKAGYKVGLYTSPYITCFNERMRVNGENITDAELEEVVDFVRPFADSMKDLPTEFELITAVAFEYFASKKCDIVVLEVGMGGELDSTNVIDCPECAVITTIDLDHTAFLGNTLEDIAVAKAGIIKNGCDICVYDANDKVMDVFKSVCKDKNAHLKPCDFAGISNVKTSLTQIVFDYKNYKNLTIHLCGTYQVYNACLSICALETLISKGFVITEKNIKDGLECALWQGRFETLGQNPCFILDGAHNPNGIQGAVNSLKTYFPDKKIIFIVGAMADKDVSGMMQMLTPLADVFFTARPDNDRAMSSQDLSSLLTGLGATAFSCDTVFDAVSSALKYAKTDSVIAAIGSLYFSSEIRQSYLKAIGKE